MAASFPELGLARTAALVIAAAALLSNAALSAAVLKDSRLPILLDAQSGSMDLRSGNEIFNKVRISQGDMVITADLAHSSQPGTKLNFNNSTLVFHGAVHVTTDQGLLTADEAQLTFVNNELTKAEVTGRPAAFEQSKSKGGKDAKGSADTIDYDVAKQMVKFSKNAYLSISDPQYEIHAETLRYDALNQRVLAPEAEQGSQRIHSIFTPPPSKTPPKTSAPAGAPSSAPAAPTATAAPPLTPPLTPPVE